MKITANIWARYGAGYNAGQGVLDGLELVELKIGAHFIQGVGLNDFVFQVAEQKSTNNDQFERYLIKSGRHRVTIV